MARHAEDREDLLRDATGLVPRVMLRLAIDGSRCDVFAGFRKAGFRQERAVSIYFDSDPVYHFNSRGELRRAFVEDRILIAERGELYRWEPQRTTDETAMRSRMLTAAEQQKFGEQILARIGQLRDAIQTGQFEMIGQFPSEADAIGQLQAWLGEFKEFAISGAAGVE
jgi:hypothetical protein